MENSKLKDNVDRTLDYYFIKRKQIIDYVNESTGLSADQIIKCGEDLSELEFKITALQIAKEN